MKIVINRCFGGFGLSKAAYNFMNMEWDEYGYAFNAPEKRTDENLIAAVEHLGKRACGNFADLKVVEVPDGVDWIITDYDGMETIEEKHRTWC